MNEEALKKFCLEDLDEHLMMRLAEEKKISLEEAMDAYYHSRLADEIYEGKYGIQNVDYKALVKMLLDTEPELFGNNAHEINA